MSDRCINTKAGYKLQMAQISTPALERWHSQYESFIDQMDAELLRREVTERPQENPVLKP
jgi:hypothetical protein